MLPHSAIYIEYIAALLTFIVQLVDIRNIFGCFRFHLRIHMRSIISDVHTTNTRIGSYINITRRNIFFCIEMSRQRGPIRYTIKVYAAVYIIRNRASHIDPIAKRIKRTGSFSGIYKNSFFIHNTTRQLSTEIRHIISRN